MPVLKPNATLSDFQTYVRELEIERGFTNEGLVDKCLLLGEEMGELFKAVRSKTDIKMDVTARIPNTEEEVADVFIMLCAVANRLGVDMEQAFLKKEEINKTRQWKKVETKTSL